ncbi:otolin-1 [Patella vulgata]|uniref:otolin-1 n=1 Tax=Patella vulgata TaxID=6465 RepID=UPI0021800E19|nr:otolin-1 [Patella vulgata]
MKNTVVVMVVLSTYLTADGQSYYTSKGNTNKCNECCRGIPGVQGMPGLHGQPGTRGMDGHKGETGSKGDKGSEGMTGAPGIAGPVGPKGERGRKGSKGPQGPQGKQGLKGDPGSRGYAGTKGEKGEKGDQGAQPPKIAFSASRSTKLGPVLQDTAVTFDRVHLNLGESFDPYTSHFICKHNGTYLFTTHILGQNKIDAYAWMMVNKNHKLPLHGDGRAGYGTGSNTIILELTVDEHVWVQLSKDSALMNDYSSFSGHILFDE